MRVSENGDIGVSPVVGVVLMVAITVLLSAVVASFVLAQAGGGPQTPVAGVSFTQEDDSTENGVGEYQVRIQVTSMENADYITISPDSPLSYPSINESETASGSEAFGDYDEDGDFESVTVVGESVVVHDLDAGDAVTVTGTINGNSQVIQTYSVS